MIKKSKELYFIILIFISTWSIWLPLILIDVNKLQYTSLILLGAFIPSLSGILFKFRHRSSFEIQNFWNRVFSISDIKPQYLILIIGVFPIIILLTIICCRLIRIPFPSPDLLIKIISSPIHLCTFIFIMLLGGPLAEELGWRGFILDYLLQNFKPIASSLILAFIWSLWHLPLFFIEGTTQFFISNNLFLSFIWIIQIFFLSQFYTWVYLNNNRSILSAIIIHFMWNSTQTSILGLGSASFSSAIELIRTLLLATLSIFCIFRMKTLSY